jgi:ABC-2 type transport system ATP-binding protein
MKRRLNLAVAVVHRPQVLLLDEPTTGVDPQSRNHIFDQVKALNAAGLTVVYTSHYMEEVQTLCTRIAILDGGQVRACDTLPNLLNLFDAVARIQLTTVPSGLVERIAVLPGVKTARITTDGLEIAARDLSQVLPELLTTCNEFGARPTALNLDQPSLERVFLHLTGRELRD